MHISKATLFLSIALTIVICALGALGFQHLTNHPSVAASPVAATAPATPTATPKPSVKATKVAPKPTPTKTVTAAPTIVVVPASPSYGPCAVQRQDCAPTTAAPAVAVNPNFTNSTSVVDQFYQDITNQDYTDAWNLGGSNLSGGVGYAQWAYGYSSTTASISLGTFSSFGSDQVQVELTALQLDGSVKNYEGTYTVDGGVITSASIVQQ